MGETLTRGDWMQEVLGLDVRAAKSEPGKRADAAPGGAPGQSAPGQSEATPASLPVAPAATGDMDPEDLVATILDKQAAILTGWDGAFAIFQTVMTSSSDAEASPNFQKTLVDFVAKELIGHVVEKAAKELPIMKQVVGVITDLQAEASRAASASASAQLRDFSVTHKKVITSLQQSLQSRRQGLISSVKSARESAYATINAVPRKKGKGGHVVDATDAMNDLGMLTMALTDLLADVERTLARSNTNALFKTISGKWLNQSQAKVTGLGDTTAAYIHIRLDKNYNTLDATIRGSGGQKLAEQMLKDSPDGVDVWAIRTLRGVVHMAHDYALPVMVDANNHNVTPPAAQSKELDELYKWLMVNGIKPTKKISGD